MQHEVRITGLGVVSPFGMGIENYWNGLLAPRNRPIPVSDLDTVQMRYRAAYSVPTGDPRERTARDFALQAAVAAMSDAGLDGTSDALIGTAIGNAMGDHSVERAFIPPDFREVEAFPFRVGGAIARHFGLDGPALSVSTACSASLYGISLAADWIRAGKVDAMLVGGAEAVSRVALACFNRLSAIDPECCRPFDRGRQGTVMGEGAAMLVLESAEHAGRRGCKRSYGVIQGWGWSCDSYHVTIPEPTGKIAAQAALAALADARLSPIAIDCVLAHGTGTEQNDLVESKVISTVLGDRAATVPICAIKGNLGHSGGAAGAFQCLTAALIFEHDEVPATGNLSQVDQRCPINLVRQATPVDGVRNILINSYAFGGNNISMIVSRGSA
jgi:3-oxoacyl-(acyl-carrier-protein) synthase